MASLAECQQTYASALEAAAALSLAGDCDGAGLRPAAEALAALPRAMGAAHGRLAALLRGLAEGVRGLLREYQAACKEIRGGAGTVRRVWGCACAAGSEGLARPSAAARKAKYKHQPIQPTHSPTSGAARDRGGAPRAGSRLHRSQNELRGL